MMQDMHDSGDSLMEQEQRFKRFAIISGTLIALLVASCGYLFWQLTNVREEIAGLNQTFSDEMNTVRESSALESSKTLQNLEGLREELSATLTKAETSVGRAKAEATRHAEKLAAELAKTQEEQRQQVADRIAQMEQESTTRFQQVSSDVGTVRQEVASNRQEIEEAVSTNFKQVRGDLGVMSGKIATNADELAALKALGERNYFEFDITASKKPVRVGDTQIALRNTESKDSRFAIDIYADDRRIEKKFKTVNEPIQFYTGGRGGQPHEIVVNEVHKNRIVGYLATPKVEMAQR
jgi:hypothetical protein